LEDTSITECQPIDSPMDPNQKLMAGQGETFSNPEKYTRLVNVRLNSLETENIVKGLCTSCYT